MKPMPAKPKTARKANKPDDIGAPALGYDTSERPAQAGRFFVSLVRAPSQKRLIPTIIFTHRQTVAKKRKATVRGIPVICYYRSSWIAISTPT
jgi:hypothetical protein